MIPRGGTIANKKQRGREKSAQRELGIQCVGGYLVGFCFFAYGGWE